MKSVCVVASPYTLSVPLQQITETDAIEMGSVYLRRLLLLHTGRIDTLKRILQLPPSQHYPSTSCGFIEQAPVSRAWRVAAASLLLQPQSQNTSVSAVKTALEAVFNGATCEACKECIRARISEAVDLWSASTTTI